MRKSASRWRAGSEKRNSRRSVDENPVMGGCQLPGARSAAGVYSFAGMTLTRLLVLEPGYSCSPGIPEGGS